ncbi:OLC1v1026908C1 [Oldenlandia corymbosa var. corymbosa]|uniref:OLC1v1026908C1 n=1 Tax=Oldenlandia corymbosa var. corymbosa TaxID=529605 RepID=A0AAV1C9Y3_OLDCO|nr:OLC1v1026908C1 [Oldenlandia corymbosa var. corymbosa]
MHPGTVNGKKIHPLVDDATNNIFSTVPILRCLHKQLPNPTYRCPIRNNDDAINNVTLQFKKNRANQNRKKRNTKQLPSVHSAIQVRFQVESELISNINQSIKQNFPLISENI